jgi:hypothetical protein
MRLGISLLCLTGFYAPIAKVLQVFRLRIGMAIVPSLWVLRALVLLDDG